MVVVKRGADGPPSRGRGGGVGGLEQDAGAGEALRRWRWNLKRGGGWAGPGRAAGGGPGAGGGVGWAAVQGGGWPPGMGSAGGGWAGLRGPGLEQDAGAGEEHRAAEVAHEDVVVGACAPPRDQILL